MKILQIVQKYHPKVKRVVDARRSIAFQVTKEDCKLSKKKSPSECALARACSKVYDGAIISMSTAYLIKGEKAIRYVVPERIARELVSFDRHRSFAPGQYVLRSPTISAKLGNRSKQDRDYKIRKKKRIRAGVTLKHHSKTQGIRVL